MQNGDVNTISVMLVWRTTYQNEAHNIACSCTFCW